MTFFLHPWRRVPPLSSARLGRLFCVSFARPRQLHNVAGRRIENQRNEASQRLECLSLFLKIFVAIVYAADAWNGVAYRPLYVFVGNAGAAHQSAPSAPQIVQCPSWHRRAPSGLAYLSNLQV